MGDPGTLNGQGTTEPVTVEGDCAGPEAARVDNRWTPSVTVILSELNSARTLSQCLTRLLSQDYPGADYHVLVLDGGSTDGSIDIVRNFASEKIELVERPGASEAAGQVLGAEMSKSEVVIFTNSDIYVPHDWVSRHVSRLSDGYDMVGGSIFWGGDKYSYTWNQLIPKAPSAVAEGSVGVGFSNFSVRRATLDAVGGVKDLSSQQDTEFALRATSLGARLILDPGIEVYHDHPLGSIRRSFERSYAYAVNHVAMDRLYSGAFAGRVKPWGAFRASLLREALLITGFQTYRQRDHQAKEYGIQMGLIEFLGARLVGRGFGHALGLCVGYLRPLNKLQSTINTHMPTGG